MTLAEVLEGITVTKMVHKDLWQGPKWAGILVRGVRYDSRKIRRGDLYVALPGEKTDGHRFIPDAVRDGASAVVVENDAAFQDAFFMLQGVVKVVVPASRKALALASCNFHGNPSRKLMLIGVTGTNGKTTTTQLIRSILEAAGHRTGIIGTIGYYNGRDVVEAIHTTPEAPELNELLASMVTHGCTAAVMEVSSHSLAMDRVHGLRFAGGVFTNITQDHLDFHKSMDEYFRAKKILFDSLEADAVAVTNLDDPSGEKIVMDTPAKRIRYSLRSNQELSCTVSSTGLSGTTLTMVYQGKE
jgi:UDP-N-acetylmuramoyl-L-alanyl-D-glutamate--2,6-diaminopimelate ligase